MHCARGASQFLYANDQRWLQPEGLPECSRWLSAAIPPEELLRRLPVVSATLRPPAIFWHRSAMLESQPEKITPSKTDIRPREESYFKKALTVTVRLLSYRRTLINDCNLCCIFTSIRISENGSVSR